MGRLEDGVGVSGSVLRARGTAPHGTVGLSPGGARRCGVVPVLRQVSVFGALAVRTFRAEPKGDLLMFCVLGQVMEEFYNIFGPELKAVTGDPKRIDDVLCRVDSLVTPMENLTFDPFSIKSSQYWKYVMDDFKVEVLASNLLLW